MTITHLLEEFGSLATGSSTALLISDEDLENERLQAFEKGYVSGWEDAGDAQASMGKKIEADLVHTLSDLSFTYQEALAQMMANITPVFAALADQLVPDVLDQSLRAHVLSHLSVQAETLATQSVRLVVGPGASVALSEVLAQDYPIPITLSEEEGMPPIAPGLSLAPPGRLLI